MTLDITALATAAAEALRGRRIAVLTGAGISTDSGIPAYRGAGTTPRTPMTGPQFLASESAQRRYWVGSHLGWRALAGAQPNAGHLALAALEDAGQVRGVITQNVDGLHRRAGSGRVIELHGAMGRVRCLRCEHVFDRGEIAARIDADNPWLTVPDAVVLGPDGDVLPESTEGFVLPVCQRCGGALKPDVVFFGEYVPVERFAAAEQLVADSDALLVAGTSLVVNSGIRILERARRREMPIVIVNREPTRVDSWAQVLLHAGTSEALPALARLLQS